MKEFTGKSAAILTTAFLVSLLGWSDTSQAIVPIVGKKVLETVTEGKGAGEAESIMPSLKPEEKEESEGGMETIKPTEESVTEGLPSVEEGQEKAKEEMEKFKELVPQAPTEHLPGGVGDLF